MNIRGESLSNVYVEVGHSSGIHYQDAINNPSYAGDTDDNTALKTPFDSSRNIFDNTRANVIATSEVNENKDNANIPVHVLHVRPATENFNPLQESNTTTSDNSHEMHELNVLALDQTINQTINAGLPLSDSSNTVSSDYLDVFPAEPSDRQNEDIPTENICNTKELQGGQDVEERESNSSDYVTISKCNDK